VISEQISKRASAWALLVTVIVAAANVAPAPFVTLLPDTVRDLSHSLQLARGEAFPLFGPPINFGPHLGPVWIWLQAIPLFVVSSISVVALFVAIVASLRFLLLFEIGRRIGGARLGLCLVAGGCFASVASFQWLMFFHPDWVATAVLASLLCSVLALQRHSVIWLGAGMGLMGLAIQFHPTAVFYLPAHLAALFLVVRTRARLLRYLALSLLLVVIWFLPLVLASDVPHQAQWQAGGSRIASGISSFHPADVVTVLHTAYVEIPKAIGESYGTPAHIRRAPWNIAIATSLGVILLGWGSLATHKRGRDSLIFLLPVALAGGFLAATLVREYTSFYLVYFLIPLSSVVIGVGLHACLAHSRRGMRVLGVLGVTLCIATFIASAVGATLEGMNGRLNSRLLALGNLRGPADGVVTGRLLGAAPRDAFARIICNRSDTSAVRGDLAYTWAASAGLDFAMHCPSRSQPVTLFGDGRQPMWTVLTVAEANMLGRQTHFSSSGLALLPVKRAIHPLESRPIEPWYYFEQLRDPRPLTRVRLEFETSTEDVVMVYRLKPFDGRMENVRVQINGQDARSIAQTFNSTLYGADPNNQQARWRIEFDTDAPQWVDVHVL
jgi:4-amino-4-deoxy-L-arabinose transferase-like glycosyltransferase